MPTTVFVTGNLKLETETGPVVSGNTNWRLEPGNTQFESWGRRQGRELEGFVLKNTNARKNEAKST